MIIIDKPTMPRIESLWAYLAVDAKTGDEGVCGAPIGPGGSFLPLIGADEERIKSLRSLAQKIAAARGIKITLVQFTSRVDIYEIGEQTS